VEGSEEADAHGGGDEEATREMQAAASAVPLWPLFFKNYTASILTKHVIFGPLAYREKPNTCGVSLV
jgi:hypothetical protein